jgi:hypothetical protein
MIQDSGIFRSQFLQRLGGSFGAPDQSIADAADNAGSQPAAAMRYREKNDSIDTRLMAEKEIFLRLDAFRQPRGTNY